MNGNIRILFWLYRSKKNPQGLAPIYVRLTLGRDKIQLSTGFFVEPGRWDIAKCRLRGNSDESNRVNHGLDGIKARILTIQSRFQLREKPLTIGELRDILVTNDKTPGFLACYGSFIERIKSLENIDYAKGTRRLFEITLDNFVEFLSNEGKSEIPLDRLNPSLAEKFSDFLKIELKNSNNTVYKKLQRINIVINHLVQAGKLQKNTFCEFRIKKDMKEIVFLSNKELTEIESRCFDIPRLELVKDLFVFSCYTGFAYSEAITFTRSNISTDENGIQWIKLERKKTGRTQEVPLLKPALVIIQKYARESRSAVFPSLSNQKLNSYLKEVGDLCGIKKKLTYHCARKTFATTMTLSKGVPIETVSKLLGHSSIAITSTYYAKVTNEKIVKEFVGVQDH